jgi:Protein of unknown function (DUF1194)
MTGTGMRALAVAGALAAATAAPAHAARVDVALVLAVDVSESIDAGEYRLQHEGIARAFENGKVIQAIQGGRRGAIDATVIEWSDRDKQIVTVGWTRIDDARTGAAFAAAVRASRRSSAGLTAIGDALNAADAAFARLADAPDRRVIDVSGDGMANIGPNPGTVRDRLVAQGITVNGLAILQTEPWLDQYYDQYVVGGDHAFLLKVENFQSFATAIEQKLLGEIAARTTPVRAAAAQIQ